MTQSKKLIEVAMPVKEISAESVRDKSIRHGHISTLHLWWARRPLPVCRAVVFASLVPDPLDENCPPVFRDTVEILLGSKEKPLLQPGWSVDPYKPYFDTPYAMIGQMEDNLRTRLMMFIGKFSLTYIENEKLGKNTPPSELLSEYSLIKWESKNNEEIIDKARKLIWSAHNIVNNTKGETKKQYGKNVSADIILADFDSHFNSIKQAEKELYSMSDRHLNTEEVKSKESKLHNAIESFLDKMPKVFDPFAGGGAIPLEAARLGCRTYANDLNPVAHIIQKGSIEFPQKFGKPIVYTVAEFKKLYDLSKMEKSGTVHEPEISYGKDGESIIKLSDLDEAIIKWNYLTEYTHIKISNRLAFDSEYYLRKLLLRVEKDIGHFYPSDAYRNKPIAYYWARVGTCSNPSCKVKVPLLKQFYLSNTSNKKYYLEPIIENKQISFNIRKGSISNDGWIDKGNLRCPVCGNTTDVVTIRNQYKSGLIEERLLAVIEENKNGKNYRLPSLTEQNTIRQDSVKVNKSQEILPKAFTGGSVISWGLTKWSELFSNRQYFFLNYITQFINEFKNKLPFDNEYNKALTTYFGIFLDRLLPINTSFGRWAVGRETVTPPFSKQAIPFVFDYPESNPFCDSTGSANNQIDWILRYIKSESDVQFYSNCINASSGDKNQFDKKFLNAVITDPPYYDAIAYADLSDFFYVWLRKILENDYPLNFATPQTPKVEECTALKHQHNGDFDTAKNHFENKLLEIFNIIEYQTSDIVSVMFAHQTTEAWTTLCNSILNSRMNITGSWAIDTEMVNRSLALASSALESSVTVACRPSSKNYIGDFKELKSKIIESVAKEVNELYRLGFRGVDLLTACFGQAVSVFGEYSRVEKSDGSIVTVAELLDITKENAFNALVKGFSGDDYTKFYIGWLQLYGFLESDFDDAAKFSRVGLSIDVSDLFHKNIFIKHGNKQILAGFEYRIKENKKLGDPINSFLIDQAHYAMNLYKSSDRNALLKYISSAGNTAEGSFWRVINSLFEVLPVGTDDYKQVSGLIANRDNLIKESRRISQATGKQTDIFSQQ